MESIQIKNKRDKEKIGKNIGGKMEMLECTDLRCRHCNSKNKCTNKNVSLTLHGINTVYQGFQHLLKCESFEEHPMIAQFREIMEEKNDE